MKMMDMGMTDSERYGKSMVTSPEEEKNKKHYESIMMTAEKMPDMGDMHAGESHKMCVEMMVKSVETIDDGQKKYKLELRKIGKMPEHNERYR